MEKLFIRSSKADTPVAGGIEKSSMIDVRDLEIERHYLSEAIKSSHNSAEYDTTVFSFSLHLQLDLRFFRQSQLWYKKDCM